MPAVNSAIMFRNHPKRDPIVGTLSVIKSNNIAVRREHKNVNNDFHQHWQAGGTGVDRMINCFQVTAAISANIVGRGRKKTNLI